MTAGRTVTTMQPQDEREWETRKTRIDGRLKAQGWKVVPFDSSRALSGYTHHAIEEFPTGNGPAGLARQQGRDYEPASVLLERIRADRAGAGMGSTTARRQK